jgi:hypothetical protein
MKKHLLVFCCAFAIASSAFAQTKLSGTLDCEKADPFHVIQIPDRQGYAYAIGQYKCTWPKAISIEGVESKDSVIVVFSEATGTSTRTVATSVTNYVNGDKGYVRSTGTGDQKAMTSSAKWTTISATGKLRGIKSSGTSVCKSKSADLGAGFTCNIEGEYTLPAAKK